MADQFTEIPVKGKKGNNAAVAGTTNVGVLAAVANAAAQTWTEGNQVLLSSDLAGNLRVTNTTALPTGANTIGNVGLVAGAAVIGAVTQSGTWTVGLSAGSALVGAVKITDAAGTNQLAVNGSGQVTISNATFASTQSGTWTVATNADGTVGAGAAGSKSLLGGLVFNTAAPTLTNGQQAALQGDTNGNLKVVLSGTSNVTVNTALPTGANTIGNVGLVAGAATIGAVNQAGTWTVATNADATVGAGTAPSKALLSAAQFNTAQPTLTTGQVAALQADVNGNLRVVLSGTSTVTVGTALPTGANTIGNVGIVAGAASIGTVGLNSGSNIVGKFGIDQTTPGTTNRVAANIDQIAGTAVPVGNGVAATAMRVVVASDNTAIPVTLGSSGTLVDAPNLTSAAVAAGGSATLATAFITNAKTGKIAEVTASSSVRIKVVVQTYNGTTATTKRVFFVRENDYFVYQPKDIGEITFAGNGTNTVFQVTITNMDNANAADVYASISYYEV